SAPSLLIPPRAHTVEPSPRTLRPDLGWAYGHRLDQDTLLPLNNRTGKISFAEPSHRGDDHLQKPRVSMRDDKTIRVRLEQLRGQLLQWGTPDLMVFTTTKDELRGWIRALEWVLQRP